MKKLIVIFLSLMMIISMMSVVSFAEDAITADGMSPIQITFKGEAVQGGSYSTNKSVENVLSGDVLKYAYSDTADPQIALNFFEEISVEEYPYVVMKVKEDTLTEDNASACGFYNIAGKGATGSQVVRASWELTNEWQWLVFDYTSAVCDIGFIRFDPRDKGVVAGQGEIAGVFAFKTLEQFEAFKATDTAKNLGANEGEKKITIRPTPTLEYLYKKGTDSTGWWNNGPYSESYISFNFESKTWFQGIRMRMYASATPVVALVKLMDDSENVLWEQEVTFKGDGSYDIYMDDANGDMQKFQPGWYIVAFECLPDEEGAGHLVVGSGALPDDVPEEEAEDYVIIDNGGFKTNNETKPCPAFAFIVCEAGEIKTPAPATDTPAPTDTPVPTDTPAPTDEPKATDAPKATDEPKSDEKKSGCGSVIGGMAVLSVIALAGTVVFSKKKK